MAVEYVVKDSTNLPTKAQLRILYYLYIFHFSTAKQVSFHLNRRTPNYTHRRLQLLLDQGLIDRSYKNNQRLRHEPIVYFLSYSGFAALKSAHITTMEAWSAYSRSLHSGMKRTKLGVHSLVNHLVDSFGDAATIYPEQLLRSYPADFSLSPLPHVLLARQLNQGTYIFDVISGSAYKANQSRRLQSHVRFVGSDDKRVDGLIIVFDTHFALHAYRKLINRWTFGYDETQLLKIRLTTLDRLQLSALDDLTLETLNPYSSRLSSLKDPIPRPG